MRKLTLCLMLSAAAYVAIAPSKCGAEKATMFPEELRASATTILTGKIAQIYSSVSTSTDTEVTHFVAEVQVERVEKGKHAAPLAYVRFYRIRDLGKGSPPPGDHGHYPTPKNSDAVRVFVTAGKDGGFDVLLPNGFESREARTSRDSARNSSTRDINH
jgi:hypothetical protein